MLILLSAAVFLTAGNGVRAEEQALAWKFAGWYGGGAFPNVEFDPVNPNRIFVTSDVAGIWRSDDGAESWIPINQGLDDLDIAAVVAAPSESNVLYAASSRGVYRSEDSGESWKAVGNPQAALTFRRPKSYRPIAVDTNDSGRLCVGTTKGGIFCSVTGGQTWRNLGAERIFENGFSVAAVQFNQDGQSIFAVAGGKVAKFNFALDTWSLLLEEELEVKDLQLSRSGKQLYAAVGNRVALTNNGGQNWVKTSSVPKGIIERIDLIESENDIQIIVAWREGYRGGILLSRNKGKSWLAWARTRNVDIELNPTWAWADAKGRILALAVSPHDPKLIFYTDWWGVFKSSDGGLNFNEKIMGLANTVGSDIIFDREENLWAATMDDGLLFSRDKGKTFLPVIPKTGFSPTINGHVWRILDFSDRSVLATSSPWGKDINQIFLIDKATLSYERVTNGLPSQRPKTGTFWREGYPRAMAVGGDNASIIYLGIDGAGGGLFRSQDGGKTFVALENQPPSLKIYNGLAAEKQDKGRIFWGSCDNNGGIWFLENETWNKSRIASNCVFDLKRSPDGTIYAAGISRGKPAVFRSSDRGGSFRVVLRSSEGSSFEALAINPRNEDNLAVSLVKWGNGSPGKILVSDNKGDEWEDITGNLNVGSGAAAITFDPSGKNIYVSLYAGSIYRVRVPTSQLRPTDKQAQQRAHGPKTLH